MPQENKTLEGLSPQEKRLLTDIKAAQGTFFLASFISVIYTAKALLGGTFNFFFSLYLPEVLLKSAAFAQDFPPTFGAEYSEAFRTHFLGKVPSAAAVAGAVVILLGCLLLALLTRKNEKLLWMELAVYGIDSVLLVLGRVFAVPEVFAPNGWIDLIFHFFVMLLLVRGLLAQKKRKALGITTQA